MTKNMSTGRMIGVIGAGLLIIGSFLPWATVEVLDFKESVLGIDGDGWFQIIFGAAILALLFTRKGKAWIPVVFAVLSLLIVIVDYMALADANEAVGGLSQFAYGFFVVALGSIAALVGTIMAMKEGKSGGGTKMPEKKAEMPKQDS